MGKVKVDREVFDALERVIPCSSKKFFMFNVTNCGFDINNRVLNSLEIEKACEIVLYGYELNETPEEKIKRVFNEKYEIDYENTVFKDKDENVFFNEGILFTLKTLGIKIEGVN